MYALHTTFSQKKLLAEANIDRFNKEKGRAFKGIENSNIDGKITKNYVQPKLERVPTNQYDYPKNVIETSLVIEINNNNNNDTYNIDNMKLSENLFAKSFN